MAIPFLPCFPVLSSIARPVSAWFVVLLALPGVGSATSLDVASVADSFVSASYVNTNYGAENFLDVHHGSQELRRTYLRFDLPTLPSGQMLTGATMYLYTEGGVQGLAIDAHHVFDDSWSESQLTWSNRPDYAVQALATSATVHGWMAWELPVARLASDADGQWSILLRLQDETASATATYYSRDATTFPNHLAEAPVPYLSLVTAPVPEPTAWAMLIAGLGLLGVVKRRLGEFRGRRRNTDVQMPGSTNAYGLVRPLSAVGETCAW